MLTVEELAADSKTVVKVCNVLRKKAGLGRINKPRRGVAGHNSACSIVMSLSGMGVTRVSPEGFSSAYSGRRFDWDSALTKMGIKPDDVASFKRFIQSFDAGLYPGLEIGAKAK